MATLQQERKRDRKSKRVVGWGWWEDWGCVNNANATSLIIDCMFPPAPPPPPTFISLFSFVSLSFHPHYSRALADVLFPVVLKLNLHIVLSLLSLLLLGHLAGNVGIHGNLEKWHWFLGEYQYRQASINIPVTHYQSNGEAAAVTPDYK